MKICAAQTRPVKGDIEQNIENHKTLIKRAVAEGVNVIIFPELSLSGYEPSLAHALATTQNDSRLDDFQTISDTHSITIGVGLPGESDAGIQISMVIFQPERPRQTYAKQYLHSDELPYFVPGDHQVYLIEGDIKIAPAICFELSVPAHSQTAFENSANVYLASVAKTAAGIEKSLKILSEIASNYSMTVLLANCLGPSDDFISSGTSSAWNTEGELIGQLNDVDEGLLIVDTDTGKCTAITLND